MARVTAAEVKEIINSSLTELQVVPYITSANVYVTDRLGASTLSAATLKEIERWFTAHMIAITRERVAKSEEAGGARIEYIGQFGEGLKSTPYGQMCISLDTTGLLAQEGKKKISMYVLGREEESE
jgi:predicted double-glycine peptidase